MLISYIRSSSYINYDFCPMQYFINYVLGWQTDSGLKAEQGTIAHKVLEILANCKKHKELGKSSFEDDVIGLVEIGDNWLEPRAIPNETVKEINKSRINKEKYVSACFIKPGHVRLGSDFVNPIIERVLEYYKDRSTNKWGPADIKDCYNFCWIALDYTDGLFDPRKRDVVDVEPHFDIPIERDWAKIGDGYLHIKGTVDLITEISPGIIEIVDWKTGQRKDWVTEEVKDYDKLCRDTQLMLYYYAAKHMYPDAKAVVLSIFFIRDGGPFTIYFEDKHIQELEDQLKSRFEEIKADKKPALLTDKLNTSPQNHWKCKYVCHFYKNKFKESDPDNMCMTVHKFLGKHGMDKTVEGFTCEGHSVGDYQAPGE